MTLLCRTPLSWLTKKKKCDLVQERVLAGLILRIILITSKGNGIPWIALYIPNCGHKPTYLDNHGARSDTPVHGSNMFNEKKWADGLKPVHPESLWWVSCKTGMVETYKTFRSELSFHYSSRACCKLDVKLPQQIRRLRNNQKDAFVKLELFQWVASNSFLNDHVNIHHIRKDWNYLSSCILIHADVFWSLIKIDCKTFSNKHCVSIIPCWS